MKKRLLSLTLIATLCLSLLPVSALAAAPENQVIYVGGQNVTNGGYWTTDSEGNVTSAGATQSSDNYIHYDTEDNILTLHNATIKTALEFGDKPPNSLISRAAIGVLNQSGNAELTIQLEGDNTIEDVGTGIYVLAHSSSTGDASLSITGSGRLKASGSVNPGVCVQSNSGGATLSIQSADVTAASTSSNGVQVRSGAQKSASLSVDGGNLTATGSGVRGGIEFQFSTGESGSGTPSLNVSNSAIVKASGDTGGITSNSSPVTPSGTGIVFDNGTGTVYGSVTLQEDLTIESGQTLDIPSGASLTIDSSATLTNEGTVTNSGTLTNNGTINNSGTLPSDIDGNEPPSITTTSLADGTVNTVYSATLEASGNPTSWEITDGSLPDGLTLAKDTGVISGKPTTSGTSTFTVKAINNGGSDSKQLSITINAQTNIPVTGVSLNKASTTLTVGDTETLTATVAPEDATNKAVTWNSNDSTVATVDESGKVTAVAPGEATITVTTEDGSKTATCTVIVHTATTITTQPQSVSVTEGQSATFSVTATGDNLRYQWQINSGNGWSAITDATDASYTIDRTTTAMSGNQYHCIVTGNGGEVASDAAMLTVRSYEPPYTGKYSYEIVSDVGENGTIDVDRYATEGDQITITVSPDEAYLLDDLTVTSGGRDVALTAGGDGTYTFTMPSGDVAITATFAEDPNWEEPADPSTDVSEIFTDVPANHWAKAAIQYVYDNGLMTGVSDTAFAPEATTTRAMIVSMLARMENVTSAADAGFTDVDASDWYATAVNWAAANDIANGISDDTFAPNDPITREQLAAMLMKYAQWKGQDTTARADLSHYSDAESISSWANDVLSWAVAEGLLAGVTDDQLQPQGQATRAQVAAIMQRFLEA